MEEELFGNPWIFNKILYYLENGKKLDSPSKEEKLKVIKQHIELAVEEKGDIAIKEIRKHLFAYTKNLKNSSEIRGLINTIETKKELINKLEEYFNTL